MFLGSEEGKSIQARFLLICYLYFECNLIPLVVFCASSQIGDFFLLFCFLVIADMSLNFSISLKKKMFFCLHHHFHQIHWISY